MRLPLWVTVSHRLPLGFPFHVLLVMVTVYSSFMVVALSVGSLFFLGVWVVGLFCQWFGFGCWFG